MTALVLGLRLCGNTALAQAPASAVPPAAESGRAFDGARATEASLANEYETDICGPHHESRTY